jgi:gas vesicle protein
MYSRNRWPETIGVLAVGIAIGTALGVLFAPRSGEETRDSIADTARSGVEGAVAQGQKFARRAQKAAGHAREQIEAATDAGERAFEEAARRV